MSTRIAVPRHNILKFHLAKPSHTDSIASQSFGLCYTGAVEQSSQTDNQRQVQGTPKNYLIPSHDTSAMIIISLTAGIQYGDRGAVQSPAALVHP